MPGKAAAQEHRQKEANQPHRWQDAPPQLPASVQVASWGNLQCACTPWEVPFTRFTHAALSVVQVEARVANQQA